MPWIVAELMLDAESVASFSDALLEHGAASTEISDAHSGTDDEQPIYMEHTADDAPAWRKNRLLVLLDEDIDAGAVINLATSTAGLSTCPEFRTFKLDDQDWVRRTQAQFEPISVSERLWIVPSWRRAANADAVNIVLDPGIAFGTGAHPTTFLCLQWLDQNVRPGDSVIDYGCGSGILAIAAKMLGAGTVIGVDIDQQAVRASRDNARRNNVDARFTHAQAATITASDIVVANILTGPLKVLAPLLARMTNIGGRLVLSGILEAQGDEVSSIYDGWFDMADPVAREGWLRLEGVRR